MNDFTKIVRLGSSRTYGGRWYSTYCEIKYIDGKLSICGVEGPITSGNALGGCGQIRDCEIEKLAPLWTRSKLTRFMQVWNKWHLNDMQAGTPAQTAELEKHEFPGYPESHYVWASDILERAGLNPDNGYKYGSAWLKVDVPQIALDFLQSLPDTDLQPAWV